MGATSVRIAQVYGTKFIGIEIPNKHREMVTIRDLVSSEEFIKSEHKIPICIGKNITGETEVVDLSKTPHLLVAGTTGSGKSVFINSLLASMLFKFPPTKLRLILIDPKMLELSVYNDIPHLLTPVVTEPRKSIMALKWVCGEMERRYTVMNEAGCRNLENFNLEADDKMPFIVVVIDEIESKRYKLLYFYEADAWELYNLSDDIGEDQNIIKKHPKLASSLSTKIKNWLTQKHPTWKPKFPLAKKDGKPVLPKFL